MSPRPHLHPLGNTGNEYIPTTRNVSLGTGRWTQEGDVIEFFSLSSFYPQQEGVGTKRTHDEEFVGEAKNPTMCNQSETDNASCISGTNSSDSTHSEEAEEMMQIQPSLFMRVTDIAGEISNHTREKDDTQHSSDLHPNYIHTLKPAPNYKIEQKKSELFIALDSKSKTPSPICFHAIEELKKQSMEFISNRNGWVPHSKQSLHDAEDWFEIATQRFYRDGECLSLRPDVIQSLSREVICWTLSTPDCPLAIRTMGILPHSASSMYELMLDSSRAKEYNQYSVGRQDLWLIKSSEECVMKVVQGENLPPLRKTPVPFVTFFRGDKTCRDGRKYLLTTRTAKLVDEQGNWDGAKFLSETKMGTNVMVDIDGDDEKCLFISSMEVKSPLPVIVAKKVGLKAGVSFINGLRSLPRK